MVLSDAKIISLLKSGDLYIEPLNWGNQIQPASVDIRIGDTFLVIDENQNGMIHLDSQISYKEIHSDFFVLNPKSFVLATTKEYFKLPDNLTAFVEGRSSIGRLGLFIQNAGWVDPGFEGEITLELFNASDVPIFLESGTRVGQLVFAQLDQNALNPYRGKYQGQKGATGSRVYLDFNKE